MDRQVSMATFKCQEALRPKVDVNILIIDLDEGIRAIITDTSGGKNEHFQNVC